MPSRPGKCQIEQHQVEWTLGYLQKPIFAGVGRLYFEAFQLEQGLKRFANRGLIIDDEDRACRMLDCRSYVPARNHRCFRHGLPSCLAESPGRTSCPPRDCSPLESFPHAPE